MGIRYNPALDGLRAVAVLAVVAYHAGMPAGFVGVDVFFVISGYLITRLLSDGVDFVGFYARRARRILPAMAVVVLVTIALSLLLLPDARDAVQSGAAASAFVANFYFQAKTGSYWAAGPMPLLHLWSLSVEEQFYLVWPLVMLFARKRIGWIFVGSLALYAYLSWADPNAAFYQMPARAWELAAGGLVATGQMSRIRDMRVGLALILFACAIPLPAWAAQPLAVLGTVGVIGALHHGAANRLLACKPMVAVGLISYSLYLWHWPLLALDRALRVGESPIGTRLALVALAFVLAFLSYRFVEQPFRRFQTRPVRAVVFGALCVASLSIGALAAAPAAKEVKPEVSVGCSTRFAYPSCVAKERKVVLWGDSFAPPWKPLAEKIARDEDLRATWFVALGCPVTLEAIPRKTTRETRECAAHNADVRNYLKAHRAEVVVIATNLADLYREHPETDFAALVDSIRPYAKRIVIVAPTPILRDALPNCEAAHDPCMTTAAEFADHAAAANAALARVKDVEVVDAGAWFLSGDRTLYDDREHVSRAAVERYLSARTRY